MSREKLEVVPFFCYPGDCLSSGGGCELATITRCRVTSFICYHLQRKISQFRSTMLMQAKLGPQPYPTCIACDVTTERWFAGCAESPTRTKSARRISWRECSLAIWQRCSAPTDSDIGCSNGWLKNVQKLNPTSDRGRGRHKKTWTELIDMDRLALGLSPTHPTGKLGGIDLEVLSEWTHPYIRE